MESRFHILGSNSSGNCALLQTARSRILIDAGFSGRQICRLLAAVDVSIESIDGIFLTHEHQDHAGGLRGLARHSHLRFFANRDTARALQSKMDRPLNWQVFATGRNFHFQDLEVTPFSVPHDAYDPVGFVFAWGAGDLFEPRRSLAWVTDLGHVPQLVRERIREVDTLVLEANYDNDLLDQDPHRPLSVKQRIRGRHGHLSNQDALELLSSVPQPRWREVYLAHLSRDCNTLDRVRQVFLPLLRTAGLPYTLNVVDPRTGLTPPLSP